MVDLLMPSTTGFTTCVGYSKYLTRSLSRWLYGLSRLVVITTPDDQDTIDMVRAIQLCKPHGSVIYLHTTNIFYAKGAKFNKGAALTQAYEAWQVTRDNWVLFFDADILPGSYWVPSVACRLREGCLHGACRFNEQGQKIPDEDMAGYFHLFHSSDPNALVRPIVDTHWYHAGNYDSTFQNRWSKDKRIMLSVDLTHLGDAPGMNWCGLGNQEHVTELHRERQRRGGKWDHEVTND